MGQSSSRKGRNTSPEVEVANHSQSSTSTDHSQTPHSQPQVDSQQGEDPQQGEEQGSSAAPDYTHTPSSMANEDTTNSDVMSSDICDESVATALDGDLDYTLVKSFVESANVGEGTDSLPELDGGQLTGLLTSVSKLFENHPSSEEALLLACQAVPLCGLSLPSHPPPIVRQLTRNAFSVFTLTENKARPILIGQAMKLFITLLGLYPNELRGECNTVQLASLMTSSIDADSHEDKQVVIQIAQDCVFLINNTKFFTEGQQETLVREGVCYGLSSLVASCHEEMSPDSLKEIVVTVMVLSNQRNCDPAFINENFYTSLMFVVQKHASNLTLQQLIWRILLLQCQKDPDFLSLLMSLDILSIVSVVIQTEGSHLTPILQFLTVCCHQAPRAFVPLCLSKEEVMQYFLRIVGTDSNSPVAEVANVCDFLAFLCTKCPSDVSQLLVEFAVLHKIQECAKKWSKECILPACMATEAILNQRPIHESTLSICHVFVKDMLTNPDVFSEPHQLEMAYLLLQKVLKHYPVEALAKLWERDFIEFFVIVFIRDVYSFPNHAKCFTFTAHYFVFRMKDKEAVGLLREFDFHTTITDFISITDDMDTLTVGVGLLASLVSKYHEHLKDMKPFLEAQMPTILLNKLKLYAGQHRNQFGDDFARTLLNLTADKDLALELFSQGFLNEVTELLRDRKQHYDPVVLRAFIHAVGNIALGGVHIRKLLLEKETHDNMIHLLKENAEKGDPHVLSACCRVLHILASGDLAKRKFVECGLPKTLMKIMRTRKDNPEVQWRPLGLLSSIGFMAVINRQYVFSEDIIEAVFSILQQSTHGKVVGYTMLVFLAVGEMDRGSFKLRQLGIEPMLQKAIKNAEYVKQSPDMERWGNNVLEKLRLFTVTTRPSALPSLPPPAVSSTGDWPPTVNISVSPPRFRLNLSPPSSGSKPLLLPLDDAYMQPYFPTAVDLSTSAKEQLSRLGLNPDEPLFRIGRVYGSTNGLCSNCDLDEASEELVIRTQSITPAQYQELINNGWYRRGGVKMFRLRTNHNIHCCDWETRVSVNQFDHRTHKSYKKVLRRMPVDRLTVETLPTHFNRDAFDLYNEYHVNRHEKPLKSEYSYCEHIVNSPIMNQHENGIDYGTYHQLYRLDGKLVAIGIIDIVPRGIVSIYMWYSLAKDVSRLSFGVYSALKEIELVRELSQKNPDMQYYYLQGWNGHNKKLSYKANYEPEEFYCPCICRGWVLSLEGVDRSKEEFLEAERRKKDGIGGGEGGERSASMGNAVDKGSETEEDADSNTASGKEESGKAMEQGSESTDGGTNLEQRPTQNECPKPAAKASSSTSAGKDGEAKQKIPLVSCSSFPNDLERYREQTGHDLVNIDDVIVCLNSVRYMRLGELFACCDVTPDQRKIMSSRYSELVAAIGPKLTSQLVIDLKACPGASSSGPPGQDPMLVES